MWDRDSTPLAILKNVSLDDLKQLVGLIVEQWWNHETSRIESSRVESMRGRPAHTDLAPVCIALCGTLGAGKTRFTQELAATLGVDPTDVTSPTFTLLRSYPIHSPIVDPSDPASDRPTQTQSAGQLHHLDAYRVGDEDEFWELGVEECWEEPGAWTIVEWADRYARCMPPESIWLLIEAQEGEPDQRVWSLWCEAPGTRIWLQDALDSWISPGS